MRFWWVNHKQTARQELSGGYLWSPKTEARGTRSQFYDNMRKAAPADIVLSYAAGRVGRVGIVTDFALEARKPTEFGSAGSYWDTVGWLLPITWFEASLSVRPKDLLDRLAPLLPGTHSPIQPTTGNGNQKAYLAEVDRAVVEVILEAAGLKLADFMSGERNRPASNFSSTLDDIVEHAILLDTSIDETTRKQLTDARRGQGVFRGRVLQVEPICRITGIEKPALLRASHIKPWRVCETAHERLDGFNGLMLAPHVDFLFDRGLICFEDDGRALFSSRLADADARKLGLHQVERPPQRPFRGESNSYFQHHRTNVFIN
jgi:putative restriction endonuclease